MKTKSSVFALTLAILFAATSVQGTTTTYQRMGGNVQLHSSNALAYGGGESAEVARIVRLARKLWDRSGKEVAKFVAYEVVLRGVDYVLSADTPVELALDVATEQQLKMSKL